jgi:hypothetical protein
MVELTPTIGRFAKRNAKVAQLMLRFAEQFHRRPYYSIISRSGG